MSDEVPFLDHASALLKLSEDKQEQLYYLAVCMNKHPDLSITQIISRAKKYHEGNNVPFAVSNTKKCLKAYAEKN